jgi:putative ABC transport system permease protein
MGSSVKEIVNILIGETLLLVSIATIFSFAVSYLLMDNWLNNFAIKTKIHFSYFLLSGFFSVLFAILAVVLQSWMAARKNPVESLRYE